MDRRAQPSRELVARNAEAGGKTRQIKIVRTGFDGKTESRQSLDRERAQKVRGQAVIEQSGQM